MINLTDTVFDFRAKSIFLKEFQAKSGITPIAAGDFSKTNPGQEVLLDNQLTRQLGGEYYHKIYPLHGDIINFTDNIGARCYCDAIVSYQKKFRPELLLCPTGDCPIITLFAKNLIAIVHSGWRGTKLRIVPKTIKLIAKKTGIQPEQIQVGIFPGICGQCYEVGDDLVEKFPHAVKNRRLDLKQFIYRQLYGIGFKKSQIQECDICSFHTLQGGNPILFSYRRDKTTARNAVFIIGSQAA